MSDVMDQLAWPDVNDVAITDFDRGTDLVGCVAAYVHAFAAPPWEEQWPDTKARGRLLEIADTPGSQFLVAKHRSRVLGFLPATSRASTLLIVSSWPNSPLTRPISGAA